MSEKKKFLLRIDAGIYDALEKWAADDLRSVNAQIEYLLGREVKKAGRAPQAPARAAAGTPPADPAPDQTRQNPANDEPADDAKE